MAKTKINSLTKFDVIETKGTTYTMPSKTDQTQRDECDLYRIIQNYGIQGRPQDVAKIPLALDTTNMPKSLEEYKIMQKECNTYFQTLPSSVRNKLGTAENLFSLVASGQTEFLQNLNIIERKNNDNTFTEISKDDKDNLQDIQDSKAVKQPQENTI